MPSLPKTLDADLERLDSLVTAYQAKEVSLAEFKAYRVPMGVYEQRQNESYMARIRATGGRITPKQLLSLIAFARENNSNLLHITTRQEIQAHNLELPKVMPLLNAIKGVELSSKGGGGNTIRNIMASPTSGIDKDEIFDVSPAVEAVAEILLQEKDSYEMPRKVKLAFTSQKDPGYAAIADLGLQAQIRDGKRGFKVYVGGGLGAKPTVGHILYEFLPEEEILALVVGLKQFFNVNGNRKNRSQARLRFVFYKHGPEKASEMLKEYIDKARGSTPKFVYKEIPEEEQRPAVDYSPSVTLGDADRERFELWKKRYVTEQRQAGYSTIYVPFLNGNLPISDDGFREGLIKFLEFVQTFGQDTIRFTPQNMQLRNIKTEALPEVYQILNSFVPEVNLPVFINSITSCTGADTCRLGVCLSKGLVAKIRKRLLDSGLDLDRLSGNTLRISGCPNSCGQHLWADIGFSGRVLRNDRSYPAYKFYAGARIGQDPALALDIGSLAAYDAPTLVENILTDYLKNGANVPFRQYIQDKASQQGLNDYVIRFKTIPSFADDKNYYFDLGAETIFTREVLGKPECAAGLYDMLKVDYDSINQSLASFDTAADDAARNKLLGQVVFNSSRLLLVTRGLDPKNRNEVFDFFIKHFIKEGIVEPKFTFLVELARNDEQADFLGHEAEVRELAKTVSELYLSLDDTLQFKVKGKDQAPAEGAANGAAAPANGAAQANGAAAAAPADGAAGATFKDLRGVACPMNFVMTKLELAKLKVGDRLRIFLDEGQPIANVPRSVEGEGHKILGIEKMGNDNYYQVLIEKA